MKCFVHSVIGLPPQTICKLICASDIFAVDLSDEISALKRGDDEVTGEIAESFSRLPLIHSLAALNAHTCIINYGLRFPWLLILEYQEKKYDVYYERSSMYLCHPNFDDPYATAQWIALVHIDHKKERGLFVTATTQFRVLYQYSRMPTTNKIKYESGNGGAEALGDGGIHSIDDASSLRISIMESIVMDERAPFELITISERRIGYLENGSDPLPVSLPYLPPSRPAQEFWLKDVGSLLPLPSAAAAAPVAALRAV
ncbi:hypothetical protein DAPPUDRAFT_233897 [Daphnia pulex]|uniref:Uncharacterized protein n=1 Tax=Daphnia pulex TaxID=6669 RepID=E9FW22_DAPPU|nr:hypothetical protein DAPPUDRAFT_233897 [Daphnia pulex]|eukprot:EFX88998.1 hypothetical protein DAPPUDRAFT_233897 [Daphnia pulex]